MLIVAHSLQFTEFGNALDFVRNLHLLHCAPNGPVLFVNRWIHSAGTAFAYAVLKINFPRLKRRTA